MKNEARKNGSTGKGRLLMLSTALLWGLAGVCVKSIPWNSMSIMAARCFIAVLMIIAERKSFRLKTDKKTTLGAVMMTLTGILYMMSIKLTTAATAIVLQYIAPILVYLYTVIFKKAKLRVSEAVIVLAVFGGCVLSFADGLDPTKMLGNILGICSGITFAAQIIIFNDEDTNSEDGMYLSNLMGLFAGLPFMFFDKHLDFSAKTIMWVLILGVFQYGLANICYAKGCQSVDKIEGALILTVEPIFNPFPVWIVTGEKPGKLAIAGFVIVVLGVAAYGALPLIRSKLSGDKKADKTKTA